MNENLFLQTVNLAANNYKNLPFLIQFFQFFYFFDVLPFFNLLYVKCPAKKTFWDLSGIWTWDYWVRNKYFSRDLSEIGPNGRVVFIHFYFGSSVHHLMDWLYSKSVHRLALIAFVVQKKKAIFGYVLMKNFYKPQKVRYHALLQNKPS